MWVFEHNYGGGGGDPYPGSANNTNFSNSTIPDSKNYGFSETGIAVSNISSSSTTMTADFKVDTSHIFSQFTEQISIPLIGSSVTWGDYDNDNDLDILLTGRNESKTSKSIFSKIYRNDGDKTFTEQTSISLIGVDGSAAWGDYDNDGYQDILLTGTTDFNGSTRVSKIYRNNGDNSFTEQTSISLLGVYESSAAWGDYDNDGDLDVLLTGLAEYPIYHSSKIYRNDGDNTFTEQTSINLTGVGESSAAWGDYNKDGYLDILLTGITRESIPITKIYRNNGNNTFTDQTSISLTGVYLGSATWGDYDDNGYLDIVLAGFTDPNGWGLTSKVYRNNGNNTFTEQTQISLLPVRYSSTAWGDYDNDGDLDILLTGLNEAGLRISKLYRNNGDNTFTEPPYAVTNVHLGSTEWGDYDNDGDLDILLTGGGYWSGKPWYEYSSKIYRNNNITFNMTPAVPSNVQAVINGNNVTFSWDKSTDIETPQNGLTYNLIVGTSPGACDILSPMSDMITGKRRIVNMGNVGHCNSWPIKDLPYGKYYWSVQAIDNCFAGSAFAETQSFTIQAPGTIIVTYPAGGEVFEIGSNPIITYSSVGNSGYVNLDYSTDGGAAWDTIAIHQLDDGDYEGWIVPNTPSENCKIRVSDVDGNPSMLSDSIFTIKALQTIVITYPKGGEVFEVGSKPILTYTSAENSGYVNLDYSTDGGLTWDTIAVNTPDDGEYSDWIVPNTPSANCKIRVSAADGDPSAISDSIFTIQDIIPVELVSFSASLDKKTIILIWKTVTEINNKGFEIERASQGGWEKIGFVSGAGTSAEIKDYSFPDNTLSVSGDYTYRLKQIDYDGTFIYSNEVLVEANLIPDKLTLSQNYPNPFNPTTTIRYGLPSDGDVKLVIYGVLGNEVALLVNEKKEAGTYEVTFNGSSLANGIYVYRLQAGNSVQTRKMVLLK
jgi:hypothetical protein